MCLFDFLDDSYDCHAISFSCIKGFIISQFAVVYLKANPLLNSFTPLHTILPKHNLNNVILILIQDCRKIYLIPNKGN